MTRVTPNVTRDVTRDQRRESRHPVPSRPDPTHIYLLPRFARWRFLGASFHAKQTSVPCASTPTRAALARRGRLVWS